MSTQPISPIPKPQLTDEEKKRFGDLSPSDKIDFTADLNPNAAPFIPGGARTTIQETNTNSVETKETQPTTEKKEEGSSETTEGEHYVDKNELAKRLKDMSIEEQQKMKDSPLHSDSTFEDMKPMGLKEEILKGLYAKGFNKPSRIQALTLPLILQTNLNLIAQSQSGTGKTCCFAVALLQSVDPTKRYPQAMCLSPTLELAEQNYQVMKDIGKFMPELTVFKVLKGMKITQPITSPIICGTPGKINFLIKKRKINTNGIKLFVLDEADSMLEAKTTVMKDHAVVIKKKLPKDCRTLLFSATYKEQQGRFDSEDQKEKEAEILEFAKAVVPEPRKFLLVPRENLTLDNMRQYYIKCTSPQDKVDVLSMMYNVLEVGQCIIFVNRKSFATGLAEAMAQKGHQISLLTGDLLPKQRLDELDKFIKNTTKVLISTNVLSRGLDVSTVTHVVNFELPIQFETKEMDMTTYLHRVGRTGRFGKQGIAINFVQTQEDYNNILALQKYFNTRVELVDRDDMEDELQ
jgi:ATP-dependent RNA helicase DDX19/DBP5